MSDFGCFGDGRHDDTACFETARTLAEKQVRNDVTQTSDGNKLGGAVILVPPGTYLITAPETLMSGTFHSRTYGYHLQGSGPGITVIDFEPRAQGPLLKNNDAWASVIIERATFTSANGKADFMDSYSTGGAQDYHFLDVTWSGHWANIFNLSGSNTNSEWDWDHVTFSATARNVLYIAPNGTSDQFLNYWFRNSKIDLYQGNFINASKGGHFKISECDFSGLGGSGNPEKPDILFGLYGDNHSSGVTHFECRNSRFELKTASTMVLKSQWGGFGEISFEDCDFSSQAGRYEPVNEFDLGMEHAAGAVQYNFTRSQIIGFVNIGVSNDDAGYRRNVSFEDVQFFSFDDYSQAVRFGRLPKGSNYGGIPTVTCVRCRGEDRNIYHQKHWTPLSEYHAGDKVYADGYVYMALVNGRSGSVTPHGRHKTVTDGSLSWKSVDEYWGSDYASEAILRPSPYLPNGSSSAAMIAFISDAYNFNCLPRRAGNGSLGFARVILPPFATITRIELILQPISSGQLSEGTYEIRTEEDPPKTRLIKKVDYWREGGSSDFPLKTPITTGETIESRTIVLQAHDDVQENARGWLAISYF